MSYFLQDQFLNVFLHFYVDWFSTTDLETVSHYSDSESSEFSSVKALKKALILADNSTLSTCRQTINNIKTQIVYISFKFRIYFNKEIHKNCLN